MEVKKYLIPFWGHQNEKVIWITFDYDKELIGRLKIVVLNCTLEFPSVEIAYSRQ